MGRYHSSSDLAPTWMEESVCAQIVSGDASATTVDEGLLAAHIENSEAEVDTYVGQRYSLPLPSVPVVLRALCCRITRYRVLSSRPGAVEDHAQKDYDAALAQLEKIAEGKISLGSDVAGSVIVSDAPATSAIHTGSYTPVLSRAKLAGY